MSASPDPHGDGDPRDPRDPRDPHDPLGLLGVWRFDRVIDDARTATTTHASGTARFVRADDGSIDWTEEGVLELADATVPVRARRVLRRDAEGWAVHFEDGRYFHPWRTGEELEHLCSPDDYRGRIDADPPRPRTVSTADSATAWNTVWVAKGPEKRYTIKTHYRPRDADLS